MKRFKNKRVLTIAAIVLVLAASAGLAGAFFSDYEHAIGQATFTLGGDTTIEEDFDGINKIITIQNRGEGDVFVRVSVFGPEEMTVSAGEGWQQGSDGFWYFQNVLPSGKAMNEEKESIKASIDNVPVTVDLSEMDIIVVHESVPVVYDADGKADFAASWAGSGIQPQLQ